jgi:hypothetical protein
MNSFSGIGHARFQGVERRILDAARSGGGVYLAREIMPG